MTDDLILGPTKGDVAASDIENFSISADSLTTHGVIVGMTGSGKTGLAICLLEELHRKKIPTIIIDPKGDMGNLALLFPSLSGEEFAPWLVDVKDEERLAEAGKTAAFWKKGLQGSGLKKEDLAILKNSRAVNVYTPGAKEGHPVNVLGAMSPPATGLDEAADGLASALLALLRIDADPLMSREHILLSNIIEDGWQKGTTLTLELLIGWVSRPPMKKLGVFDLDDFYPPAERMKLAMKLNNLLASSGFSDWLSGDPLDVEQLLARGSGPAPVSVFNIAHLGDDERQFFVSLLLSRVVSWMRKQPGTSELRALIYMDEVFGYAPPTKNPPSKRAILTILKQARAHGLAMVLATQNPVDLDYKAMSNAGMWLIGRLQTERDKARILEALKSSDGSIDTKAYDALIGSLAKREFVGYTTKSRTPTHFGSRWAMSYLRGPLTLVEVAKLNPEWKLKFEDMAGKSEGLATPSGNKSPNNKDSVPVKKSTPLALETAMPPPLVAEGITEVFLDDRARWLQRWSQQMPALVTNRDKLTYRPAFCAEITLRFDDRKSGIDSVESWSAIALLEESGIDGVFEVAAAELDERDYLNSAVAGALFSYDGIDLSAASLFKKAASQLKETIYHDERLELFNNEAMKLFSLPKETREAFLQRCDDEAEKRADADVAKLRGKIEKKIAALEKRLGTATAKLVTLQESHQSRRMTEWISGAGSVLSLFLGGRSASRTLAKKAASRLGGLSSRHSQTSRAGSRVEEQGEKIERLEEELEIINEGLQTDILEINQHWDDVISQISDFSIGLEKNDISISTPKLLWMPI